MTFIKSNHAKEEGLKSRPSSHFLKYGFLALVMTVAVTSLVIGLLAILSFQPFHLLTFNGGGALMTIGGIFAVWSGIKMITLPQLPSGKVKKGNEIPEIDEESLNRFDERKLKISEYFLAACGSLVTLATKEVRFRYKRDLTPRHGAPDFQKTLSEFKATKTLVAV